MAEPKYSYNETEVAIADLKGHYAASPWDKLAAFIASIRPDDKLFRFEESSYSGPLAARGRKGYYRLTPSGEKHYCITSSWMS